MANPWEQDEIVQPVAVAPWEADPVADQPYVSETDRALEEQQAEVERIAQEQQEQEQEKQAVEQFDEKNIPEKKPGTLRTDRDIDKLLSETRTGFVFDPSRPPTTKDIEQGKNLTKALGAGGERIAAGLTQTLPMTAGMIYDLFAIPQNLVAKWVGRPDMQVRYRDIANAKLNPLKFYEQAADDLVEMSRDLSPSSKFDQGIIDNFKAGNIEQGAEQLSYAVAENLPQYLFLGASVVTGNPNAGLALLSSSAAGGEFQELKTKEGMSDAIKYINSVTKGLSEFLWEKATTLPTISKLLKGGKAVQAPLKKGIMTGLKKWAERLGLIEGFGEWGTEVTNNITDIVTGNRNADGELPGIFDNSGDAALIGTIMGNGMTLADAAINARETTEQERQEREAPDQAQLQPGLKELIAEQGAPPKLPPGGPPGPASSGALIKIYRSQVVEETDTEVSFREITPQEITSKDPNAPKFTKEIKTVPKDQIEITEPSKPHAGPSAQEVEQMSREHLQGVAQTAREAGDEVTAKAAEEAATKEVIPETPFEPKEVDYSKFDPRVRFKEKISRETNPDEKSDLETSLELMSSDVTDKMMSQKALDIGERYLVKNEIPYTVAFLDLLNLGGANKYLPGKHSETNTALRKIYNDIVVPRVEEAGGRIARQAGSDEIMAILPNMTEAQVEDLMAEARVEAEKVAKELGLLETRHPKHAGMPTGALLFDYGVAAQTDFTRPGEARKTADIRMESRKDHYLLDIATKNNYVYNEETESYEPRKDQPETEAAQKRGAEAEVAEVSTVERPPDSGERSPGPREAEKPTEVEKPAVPVQKPGKAELKPAEKGKIDEPAKPTDKPARPTDTDGATAAFLRQSEKQAGMEKGEISEVVPTKGEAALLQVAATVSPRFENVKLVSAGVETVKGFYDPDTKTLYLNTDDIGHSVFYSAIHEAAHDISDTEFESAWEVMDQELKEGSLKGFAEKRGLTGAEDIKVRRELFSEAMSELFTKPETFNRIAETSPNFIKRLLKILRKYVQKLSFMPQYRTSQMFKDLKRVQDRLTEIAARQVRGTTLKDIIADKKKGPSSTEVREHAIWLRDEAIKEYEAAREFGILGQVEKLIGLNKINSSNWKKNRASVWANIAPAIKSRYFTNEGGMSTDETAGILGVDDKDLLSAFEGYEKLEKPSTKLDDYYQEAKDDLKAREKGDIPFQKALPVQDELFDVPDIRKDREAEVVPMMDEWLGNREVEIQRGKATGAVIQDRIVKSLGQKKFNKKAENVDKAIQLYIDMKNYDQAELDDFAKGLEGEEKETYELANNLNDKQQQLAEDVISLNREIGVKAKDAGVIANIVDNYSMRLWEGETPSEQVKQEGSLRRKFGLKTPRSKRRTLNKAGIIQGWAKGMTLRVKGASNAHMVMSEQIAQVIEDRNLLEMAKNAKLISEQQYEGWEQVEHPNFTIWKLRGEVEAGKVVGKNFFIVEPKELDVLHRNKKMLFERVPVFAEPKLAKRLNNILGTSKLNEVPFFGAPIKTITRYNAELKHTILTLSLYHHQAFLRSYMFGARTGVRNLGPRKAYKAGLEAIKSFGPEVQELVWGGLTLGKIQDFDEESWQREQTKVAQVIDKIPGAKQVKDKILALREKGTNFLFNKLGPGLKMQAALLEYRHLLKKHHKDIVNGKYTPHDMAKMTANIINDDFGGLNLARIGKYGRNPTTQHIYRLLSLAPDWTESNIRSMVKAFKRGDEGAVYRAFWTRIALKSAAVTLFFGMVGSMLAKLPWVEDEPDLQERYKKAWEEGHLRWMDLDYTPYVKALGMNPDHRKYFSIIGHFRDPIKFMVHPVRSAKHKGSVMTKFALELATRTDWASRKFTTIPELFGLDEKGVYKTARKGYYKKGDPKGGQLKGRLVQKYRGGVDPLFYLQIPSFALYQARSVMPIPAQSGASFIGGELDAWDAIAKSSGFMVSRSYKKPKEKERFHFKR